MTFRRAAACLAATGLLAAGCSDDGGDTATSSTATTSDSETTANEDDGRTQAELDADEEAARSALLVLDDFPPGWEAAEPDPDNDNDDVQEGLADCLDVDVEMFANDNNPSAESPAFTSPNDDEVSSEVTYTASIENATRTVAILKDPDTPGCYAQALKAYLLRAAVEGDLPDEVEYGDPTFNPLSFPTLGDESVAFRMTFPVSARGLDVDVYIDLAFVRVGRVGVTTTFQSQFSPFDTDEAARLTETVVDRISKDNAA
jgi:hypothetical protein